MVEQKKEFAEILCFLAYFVVEKANALCYNASVVLHLFG